MNEEHVVVEQVVDDDRDDPDREVEQRSDLGDREGLDAMLQHSSMLEAAVSSGTPR